MAERHPPAPPTAQEAESGKPSLPIAVPPASADHPNYDGFALNGALYHKECAPPEKDFPELRMVVVAPGDICAKCLKYFGTAFQAETEFKRKERKEKAERTAKEEKEAKEHKDKVAKAKHEAEERVEFYTTGAGKK